MELFSLISQIAGQWLAGSWLGDKFKAAGDSGDVSDGQVQQIAGDVKRVAIAQEVCQKHLNAAKSAIVSELKSMGPDFEALANAI